MALAYTGYRRVTKGKNYNDSVHLWKGTVGVYSNWDLMNPSQVLDGAPNTNTVLGDSRDLSSPRLLELIFSGKTGHKAPMANSGNGPMLDWHTADILEYKGLSPIFASGYGHTTSERTDYARYTNFVFDGIDVAETLKNPGHAIRYDSAWGGAFAPYIWKGLADPAMTDPGSNTDAPAYDNDYGKNKVLEWRGVASSSALSTSINESLLGTRALSVSPSSVEFDGDPATPATEQLTATANRSMGAMILGEEYDVTKDATWESSDTNVATVDSDGVVTPAGDGECTITATYDGFEAECSVTVTNLD